MDARLAENDTLFTIPLIGDMGEMGKCDSGSVGVLLPESAM